MDIVNIHGMKIYRHLTCKSPQKVQITQQFLLYHQDKQSNHPKTITCRWLQCSHFHQKCHLISPNISNNAQRSSFNNHLYLSLYNFFEQLYHLNSLLRDFLILRICKIFQSSLDIETCQLIYKADSLPIVVPLICQQTLQNLEAVNDYRWKLLLQAFVDKLEKARINVILKSSSIDYHVLYAGVDQRVQILPYGLRLYSQQQDEQGPQVILADKLTKMNSQDFLLEELENGTYVVQHISEIGKLEDALVVGVFLCAAVDHFELRKVQRKKGEDKLATICYVLHDLVDQMKRQRCYSLLMSNILDQQCDNIPVAFQIILKLFAFSKVQLYFSKHQHSKVYGTINQDIESLPQVLQQLRIANFIEHKPIFPNAFLLHPYQGLDAVQITTQL